MPKMAAAPRTLLPLLAALLSLPASALRVESDGGYAGLVVRIREDAVPEQSCKEILDSLKVREAASEERKLA